MMSPHSFVPSAIRPAGPVDDRFMPRVLQAFNHNMTMSKPKRTASKYVRCVKRRFNEDRVSIEDMVSEAYLSIVKKMHHANTVTALHSFCKWFQNAGLSVDTYKLLPEVAPEN